MKKRILRFILGFCYICLLTLLLLSQFGPVTDAAGKWRSALAALLIGVPWVIVLKLYNDITESPKEEGKDIQQKLGRQERQEDGRDVEVRKVWDAGWKTGMQVCTGDIRKAEIQVSWDKETAVDVQEVQRDIREIHTKFELLVQEYELTQREEEVAWLLYRGYTNRQIGEELFIAEATVKKHVSHIYEKVHVMSRKEFRTKIDSGFG